MKTKLRLFIYGNDAARNRRPTVPGDCEDYWEEDIEVSSPKELGDELYKSLYDYDEDDLEDIDFGETADSIEEIIDSFDGTQDYSDGSKILYAVYDLTNKKWLLGNENSKREWLTEYISPEEYEEEGYDLDEISEMKIN